MKLGTVLYPNLAYANSFTEKFCSLKQILCKVKLNSTLKIENVCVVAPLMDNKYCCYISMEKFAICDI